MSSFPEGWFFIKNHSNGYFLSIENSKIGESVVISSLRNTDYESQLWRYGDDGRVYNKKSNFILDVAKGETKPGTDIIQQSPEVSSKNQIFKTSSEGHIYLAQESNLALGITDSFFGRKEGQHVHLQMADINSRDRKEQCWVFVLPSVKHSPSSSSVYSLKRTISGTSLGSLSSATGRGDFCSLNEECNASFDSFPEGSFFIKSDNTGHYISVELASVNSPGSRLILEPLRKNSYEAQLWNYDAVTGRLVNKASGFYLSAEEMSDDSRICQSPDSSDSDFEHQAWVFTAGGEIRLKSNSNWILGFKKDSWFGLGRENTNLLLQRKPIDGRAPSKFTIVLPVFKKVTSKIATVSEQTGVFPEGFFFIKNQKNGLVLTISDSGRLAAEAIVIKLDTENYNHQLWKHNDGFLFNKVSKLVLDIRGGCVVNGAEICHYRQKTKGYENQQWSFSVEGYIYPKTEKDFVLAVDDNKTDRSNVFLAKKKISDHEEQLWNFILPVFKEKSASGTVVKKPVISHHYAQYPSGWFFIRSFVNQDISEIPFVLTADSEGDAISLREISKELWRNQLWMYWNGVLINFQTQYAMHANAAKIGSTVCQKSRQSNSTNQHWSLTTDGRIIQGSNPSLSLMPEKAKQTYIVTLADHAEVKKDHYWGLLTPKMGVENGIQVLLKWSIAALSEWKKSNEQEIQKMSHCVANWPEQPFFIGAHDNMALVPEKSEAYSFLVLRKIEIRQSEIFKWVYRNGYIVHCETGLVLHALDDLVSGGQLQIREELISDSKYVDKRQQWFVKTDGSIISQSKNELGFTLIQQGAQSSVQLGSISNTSEHYGWTFLYGHYASRFSEVYQKKINVLTHTDKILLTVKTDKVDINGVKIRTRFTGAFPKNWFFICSRTDKSFVLAVSDAKEGSKLILSKIDYKNFRPQLWRYQDDGCLANLSSSFVIDIAGGAFNHGSNIIQWHEKYLKRNRDNQMWGRSVDGHIFPKLRPGLVLGSKDGQVFDGVEIQLLTRGSLNLEYQRFIFATPVFGRQNAGSIEISSDSILENNNSDIFISKLNETNTETTSTTSTTQYESDSKVSLIRRWGVFPEGSFFIRAGYGQERFSLTVEKKPRTRDDGNVEHEVTLRPIDFSDHKWHLWTYSEGHLVNVQTSLSLDATFVQGLIVEDGFHTSLFARERSMSEHQFWSLTANGEIHLRSDERLVIGVSSSERVSVSGAQVGLLQLETYTFINENGQQETSLKSEPYLKWVFSKPVFQKANISNASTMSTSGSTQAVQEFTSGSLSGKKHEVSVDDNIKVGNSVSNGAQLDNKTHESGKKILGLAAAATVASGIISSIISSSPTEETTKSTHSDDKKTKTQTVNTKIKSHETLKSDLKETVHSSIDYVSTESGKVSTISSSTAAFKSIKKTYHHKIYQENQWPACRSWFFICFGKENLFLSSGETDACEVKFVKLSENEDHKRFLWLFINGYLVNYKYMLRLVYDTDSSHLGLSNRVATLDQHFSISSDGQLSISNGLETIYLSVDKLTEQYEIVFSQSKTTEQSSFALQLHVPVYSSLEVESSSKLAISATILWVQSSQVISTSKYIKTEVTQHYRIFPIATWFFIKTLSHGSDGLALTVKNTSGGSSDLVLKKLNFKDFRNQLWTFKDGLLINYNSNLVLDVYGDIKENSKLIQSKEAGVGSQKWILTSGSYICLESYSHFALGFKETLKEDTEVSLVSFKQNTNSVIHWHFSVPIFGKSTIKKASETSVSATTIASSSIEQITESIEQGAVIESIEEIGTKMDDSFVDKRSSIKGIGSTQEIAQDSQHGFHEILKDVGIAATAGVVGATVMGAVSKMFDKRTQSESSKKSQSTVLQEQTKAVTTQNIVTTGTTTNNSTSISSTITRSSASVVTDQSKSTDTVIISKPQQTTIAIIEDDQSNKLKTKIAATVGAVVAVESIMEGKKHVQNDSSDSKVEYTDKRSSLAAIGKVTVNSASDISVIINKWYEAFITDVFTCAKKGGSGASSDISTITQEATKKITEILNSASANAHLHVSDISTVQQYRDSIERSKNLVLQSSHQIKLVGIQSASSKTSGIEQMRSIATSSQYQVNSEIRRYTSTSQSSQGYQKMTKDSQKMHSCQKSTTCREDYCSELEKSTTAVISETKKTLVEIFESLIGDVSIVIHRDFSNTKKISQVIEKHKMSYIQAISQSKSRVAALSGEYENNSTFVNMKTHTETSFKEVQIILENSITDIEKIAKMRLSECDMKKMLSAVLESFKTKTSNTLGATWQTSVDVIQTEKSNTESTVTITNTVEEVKVKVSSWHKKLSKEVHNVIVDSTIEKKEERIRVLVQEAINEIDRLILEARLKFSGNSTQTMSRSYEQELLKSLDYIKTTFSADVHKIEQVSLETITKSNSDFNGEVSSVIKSSGEKIRHVTTSTTATGTSTTGTSTTGTSTTGTSTTGMSNTGAATSTATVVSSSSTAVSGVTKSRSIHESVTDTDNWAVDVGENSRIISEWFNLYINRLISEVNKRDSSVMKNIDLVSQNAQKEISEMIATARTNFKKRLTFESVDQETYDYACKHYEEGLESVRNSISKEIYEAKTIATKTYTTGRFEHLEIEMTELTKSSAERINAAIGSSVMITQKAESSQIHSSRGSGSVLQIALSDEDTTVIGEEETITQEAKKVEHVENKRSSMSEVISDANFIGTGAIAFDSQKKKQTQDTIVKTSTKKSSNNVIVENKRPSTGEVISDATFIGTGTIATFDSQKKKQTQDTTVKTSTKKSSNNVTTEGGKTSAGEVTTGATAISIVDAIALDSQKKQQTQDTTVKTSTKKSSNNVIAESRKTSTDEVFAGATVISIVDAIALDSQKKQQTQDTTVKTSTKKSSNNVVVESRKPSTDEVFAGATVISIVDAIALDSQKKQQTQDTTVKTSTKKSSNNVIAESRKPSAGEVIAEATVISTVAAIALDSQKKRQTQDTTVKTLTKKSSNNVTTEGGKTSAGEVIAEAIVISTVDAIALDSQKKRQTQDTIVKTSTKKSSNNVIVENKRPSTGEVISDATFIGTGTIATFDSQKKKQTQDTTVKTSTKKSSNNVTTEGGKTSAGEVTTGATAISIVDAIALDSQKKQQTQDTTVETTVKISSITEVQTKVNQWLSSLSQEVIICTKRGGSSNEVKKIVDRAQAELQVTLSQFNFQDVTSETHRTFSSTLEWIKNTVLSQSNQINHIVRQRSFSTMNMSTQIENHMLNIKNKINSGLEIQRGASRTMSETHRTGTATTTKDTSEITMIESRDVQKEKITQVHHETREQTKERVRLEMSPVVQECKTEITHLLDILMESINITLHGTSGSIRKDILTRLDTTERELEALVRQTKQKFITLSKKAVTSRSESETQRLVLSSVSKAQDSIEIVKDTMTTQVSAIRNIFTQIQAEDIQIIIQRVSSIIEVTKQRVSYTLDRSVHVSIESAFEGKTAVWSQVPLQIPESFKNVRAFAFDIAGTVGNYHKTLHQAWERITAPKKDAILAQIDFGRFIQDWFNAFVEMRGLHFSQRQSVSDRTALRQALIHVCNNFHIKEHHLTESEKEELCDTWRKMDIYEDANIGIQHIKNQVSKKYVTVSISDTFSTQSMIELAQNGCLCWNAQFSFDMFTAQSRAITPSESVLEGAIGLLGLENANQLAVVSCHPQLISAAKKQGCHVVMVEREGETVQKNIQVDMKVTSLDVLGQSIQSYTVAETLSKKEDYPKPPSVYWFNN
ncbi:carbohydrate-binding module family 13 protein [Backusella circina FSU 941]|nr:carbohydrate-binding module family 13 protein [Backusella circina FSU 941]